MILGLFAPRLPIDQDEYAWILACFRWFVAEYGGLRGFWKPGLVLPDAETFPPSRKQGHARALELFEIVKRRAGMLDWPCDLLPGEPTRGGRVAAGLRLTPLTKEPPLGTFGFVDGRYRITYNPSELERPHSLVAIFAHELAHYFLHAARSAPPGGRDLHEHATDLAAVYLGFGLFLANSARSFRQFQDSVEQGWEMRRQGYLSELSLVTALAFFVQLVGADPRKASHELKPYLRAPFHRARKAIGRMHPDPHAALAAIDPADWG